MSLANLFVQDSRVVLQADAGGYLPDGTVAWLGPKIHVLTALPCAFALRGSFDHAAFAELMRGKTFVEVEEFLAELPALVARFAELLRAAGEADPMSCWYVACYTRGRPWAFLIASDDRWFAGKGVRAGELRPVRHSVGGFAPASEMLGRPVDLADPASFDIERDSPKLIEAQRAEQWADYPLGSVPGAVPAHRIGGWVDQAEVTATGVSVRRLLTWESDREGERIAA
jgi:hypothetical protein